MRAESDWEKVGGIADESIRLKKGRVPVFKKMRDRMVKGVMGKIEGVLRRIVTVYDCGQVRSETSSTCDSMNGPATDSEHPQNTQRTRYQDMLEDE